MPFTAQRYEGHNHFFHRNAAVLERVAVVADVAVRVVVVNQKIRIVGEDVARREVARRQLYVLGFQDLVDRFGDGSCASAGRRTS